MALVFVLFGVGGCSSTSTSGPSPSDSQDTTSAPTKRSTVVASGTKARKYSFKDSYGRELFKVKVKEPGRKYKLYEGGEEATAVIKVYPDRVKVKDAHGELYFKIKRKSSGVEIEDGAGKRLYRIKPREEGGWKLEGAGEEKLFKIKAKSDGYEISRADGNPVAKVKLSSDKVKFVSEEGEELFVLKPAIDLKAALWLGIDELPVPLRTGLMVFYLDVK